MSRFNDILTLTDPVGTTGMVHILKRKVGAFHHGQTLLLSESGNMEYTIFLSRQCHAKRACARICVFRLVLP